MPCRRGSEGKAVGSREEALDDSVQLGLAGLAAAVPAGILPISEAQAQQPSMSKEAVASHTPAHLRQSKGKIQGGDLRPQRVPKASRAVSPTAISLRKAHKIWRARKDSNLRPPDS